MQFEVGGVWIADNGGVWRAYKLFMRYLPPQVLCMGFRFSCKKFLIVSKFN